MKFYPFSIPSIPCQCTLRDSGSPSCLRKRLMSLAVDVSSTCKKYRHSIQNLSNRLRYKLRHQTALKFSHIQAQAALFPLQGSPQASPSLVLHQVYNISLRVVKNPKPPHELWPQLKGLAISLHNSTKHHTAL